MRNSHIPVIMCLMSRKFSIKHAFKSRKFKGGICCGSHLAITYGGQLLYLWIFLWLSPPNNFVKPELPFPQGLKSRTHIGYRAMNPAVMIMRADRTE